MMEKIFFDNGRGIALCGVLEMPNPKAPIVILCHGFSTSKNTPKIAALWPRLLEQGMGSFRFDFFAHGESGGDFEKITLSEAVRDVKAAFAYMRHRFPQSQIALCGSSFGGAACFYACSQLELKSMVLVNPVAFYKEKLDCEYGKKGILAWKELGYIVKHEKKISYSFYDDLAKYDGKESARSIRTPTVFIHGDKDDVVDYRDSQLLASIVAGAQLYTVEGGDHTLNAPEYLRQVVDVSLAFFQKTLDNLAAFGAQRSA